MNATRVITPEEVAALKEKSDLLTANVAKIIRGKEGAVTKILTTLLAGGHVLLEDLPGQGKTAMAKALAFSIQGAHSGAQGEDHAVF
ncbi:MAG: ATPase, partial [Calditrichaeota bacterium]|nr:ATPase [Calditrichota bacterium]